MTIKEANPAPIAPILTKDVPYDTKRRRAREIWHRLMAEIDAELSNQTLTLVTETEYGQDSVTFTINGFAMSFSYNVLDTRIEGMDIIHDRALWLVRRLRAREQGVPVRNVRAI